MTASINRRDVIRHAAGLALGLSAAARSVSAATAAKPNILFILADDLGYADLSIYGRRDYETPVLDRLARDGLMLTQGYANSSVCSATRFALITGRYQYRIPSGLREPGMGGDGYGLPAGYPTLPLLMKQAGYRTSLFGKWHLGTIAPHLPNQQGYDHFFGFLGAAADYFRVPGKGMMISEMMGGNPPPGMFPGGMLPPGFPAAGGAAGMPALGMEAGLYENAEPVTVQGYLTDLLADRAVTEIAACAKRQQPFFMSLHFNAPHSPWEGPHDEQAIKDGSFKAGGSLQKYAEMVVAMDSAIGRVLRQLKSSGIERDTLVVFTSDNGGERFSDDWPFVGMKGELLEGGLRVPLIARWPARIRRAQISTQVMTTMDFLPTLLAAAGGAPDATLPSDGMNLLPVWLGEQPVMSRKLFWRYKANDQQALRDGDWKYLKIGNQEKLFNLAEDVRERADLRNAQPERFAQMKADYASWNATMLPYPEGMLSFSEKGQLVDRY